MGYRGLCPRRAVGIALGALLLAALPIGSASAQNQNLTATAQYSASSAWEEDLDNPGYVAAKAFDGNLTTRWNSYNGDAEGSWLAARWDQPVTVNKVVIREAYSRVTGFRVQQFDSATNDWADVVVAEGDLYTSLKQGDPGNPTYTVRFAKAVTTTGIRVLFTQANTTSLTIFEIEAYGNPAGTLQGTVRDEAGNPVASALVQAGSDSTFTGADGRYTLVADAGTYNVTADKPGAFRRRVVRNVEIAPDASATLDFALTALPPNLARTATAASSSDWEDGEAYNAAKANDGSVATRWNARSDDVAGAWLEVGWDQPQTFTKVVVRQHLDRIRNYSIQAWDAASSDYKDLVSNVIAPVRGGDATLSHVFAQPITSTKVRLLINDATAVATVFELEVSNPQTTVISGVVNDVTSGQPVGRATITSDLGDSVVADDKGAFTLVVEPDDYVVSARAEGYFQGAGVPVTAKAGEAAQIVLTIPAPGPNLAQTGKPISSSQDDASPASNITDGDLETYWQTALDKHANEWVGVQWDQPTRFTVVQVRGVITLVQSSYLQVLAEDGTTWVDVPKTTFNVEFQGANQDFLFPAGITTKGIRWFAAATWGVEDNPGLSELLVFNSPIPQ